MSECSSRVCEVRRHEYRVYNERSVRGHLYALSTRIAPKEKVKLRETT